MRVLFLGDVVGRTGRDLLIERMPDIRKKLALDFVVVNGENAAGGFGITGKICTAFYDAGVDVISTGNHIWGQQETAAYIQTDERLLRPINYPPNTPGRGAQLYKTIKGKRVLVINVMARTFMDPLDDPFAAVDTVLARHPLGGNVDFILIDIHGEASSEKMAMGHFADGRASLVVGTHSHIPTADAQILPNGTAYQTDAGMCGDYNSVIGMEKDEPLRRFTRRMPSGRFSPATGDATLCGVFVETDTVGKAQRVAPLRLGARLHETWPIDS